MIVRDKPQAWELLFILHGSIVPKIWPQILLVVCLASLVTGLQSRGLMHSQPIAALPFSLIGIALSIFAGFRNSASYERWWEARKILGQLVIDARSLSRQALAYVPQESGERLAHLAIAFSHALRCHLRDEAMDADVAKYLAPDMADRSVSPNRVLDRMSREIAAALAAGTVIPQMAQSLEERVVALSGVLAGAERIKLTPLPFAYSLLLHRTAYLFCFLLPFGIVDSSGFWTPLLAAIVAYTFFGLDALGDELSEPFGTTSNALPIAAITRAIEISILEQMGATDRPEAHRPKQFVLR